MKTTEQIENSKRVIQMVEALWKVKAVTLPRNQHIEYALVDNNDVLVAFAEVHIYNFKHDAKRYIPLNLNKWTHCCNVSDAANGAPYMILAEFEDGLFFVAHDKAEQYVDLYTRPDGEAELCVCVPTKSLSLMRKPS